MTASSTGAAQRLPPIDPADWTPEQKKVADEIVSGPRGGMPGPFNAWLRSPDLAARFQKVGEYARFMTSLPPALNELAILLVARDWSAAFEWYAHYQLAMKAGLSPAIADAIAQRRRPATMSEDEAMVYDFVHELLQKRNVSDAAFEKVRKRFGERGVVDLIGTAGYYVAVSMTLNVAGVPVPAGSSVPSLSD
ncbi:MAG: carboxymuconolactone decarboxylase family protein [Acidibrevibacterium sp.]|uniref:carboxymuconolactone decarboxylase family protein n=1 Tax=Acidibrevibacterium sp. TaxID=2606776 RepID=UPI003D01D138